MDEEQYLLEQIDLLRREYEKVAKPYIDRLAQLQALKPVPPVFFPSFDSLSPETKEMISKVINRGVVNQTS